MEIKNRLLVPSFILIILAAGYIGYTGIFPFFYAPKIALYNKILRLEEPLIIHFDRSVVHHKTESTFSLTPSVVGKINWQGDDLVFEPIQPWEPDKKYQVTFQGMTKAIVDFSFEDNFTSESLPRVERYTPNQGALTGPQSPIEFYLDKGRENFRMDFKVAPAFNYTLSVDPERKFFQIKPEEPLKQNTDYQVIAYEGYQSKDSKIWYSKEMVNFQFKTISPPEVQKIMPANDEEDVKEFTPIKVYFNKPMETENWNNFVEITPNAQGKVEWEEEGKVFVFKPYRWNQNTNYAVKVRGGWKAEDETYLNEDFLSSFRSYDSSGLVKKQSSAARAEAKIKEGKYVDINLSKQILSIFNDGKNMGNYRVSTGKRGMATPTGMFDIKKKNRRAWSKRYKLFMPYWMQFTNQGHGIHELPEWPSGYKEGANHLGVPVSHGCVRLGVGPAATVYGFVDVGTPVYIHY